MKKIKKSSALVLSATMMLGAVSQVNYEPLAGTYPQLLELPMTTLEIGQEYTIDPDVDMMYSEPENHWYYENNSGNPGTLSTTADAVYKVTIPAYSSLDLNLPTDYDINCVCTNWYDSEGNYLAMNHGNSGRIVNSTASDKTYIVPIQSYDDVSFTATLGTLTPDFDGQVCVYTQGDGMSTSNPLSFRDTTNIKIVEIEPHYSHEEYIAQAKALCEMSTSTSIITADSEYVRDFIESGNYEPLSDIGFNTSAYTSTAYDYTIARGSVSGSLYAVTWEIRPKFFTYNVDIAEEILGTSDPAQVQAKIDTTEEFLDVAAKMKAAGYLMCYGKPDDINNVITAANIAQPAGSIDNNVKEFFDTLLANEYIMDNLYGTVYWDQSTGSAGKIFGNFNGYDMSISNWVGENVRVCQGPLEYAYGGQYLLVNNKNKGNDSACQFLESLCCDTKAMKSMQGDVDYMYKFINNKTAVQEFIAEGKGNYDNCGGQNVYSVWDAAAKSIYGPNHVPDYFNITTDGGTFDGNHYYLPGGTMVKDAFFCDGTYTYYLQADGTPMKDRLTYHPDGKHVIYFDANGHEVFSDFANVRKTISGESVDDYCFFDVNGYLYVDVVTYDKEGKNLYYANPYGVLERGKWFQFSDTVMCADGTPWNGAAGNYGYANADGTLMVNTWTYDWEGRLCYMQGNGVALY